MISQSLRGICSLALEEHPVHAVAMSAPATLRSKAAKGAKWRQLCHWLATAHPTSTLTFAFSRHCKCWVPMGCETLTFEQLVLLFLAKHEDAGLALQCYHAQSWRLLFRSQVRLAALKACGCWCGGACSTLLVCTQGARSNQEQYKRSGTGGKQLAIT